MTGDLGVPPVPEDSLRCLCRDGSGGQRCTVVPFELMPMPDQHTQAVLDDIQRAMTERRQQEAVALMEFYNGQAKWFEARRRSRTADEDYQLATVLVRLLRAAGRPGSLRCRDADSRLLGSDPPVLALWRSVAAFGPDG